MHFRSPLSPPRCASTDSSRATRRKRHAQTFISYTWRDDDTLIAAVVPPNRGPIPVKSTAPPGPRIEANEAGRVAQSRTYTDLLKDPFDETLFEHYCQSQLVLVDARSGKLLDAAFGGAAPRLYTSIDPSPDGKYILAEMLERPFSFAVPCGRFPNRRQLWRADGTAVRDMVVQPLAETIPILKDCVRPGPRGLAWRSDAPATLYWAEAQDGGDKRNAASPRDVVYSVSADEVAATKPEQPLSARKIFECDFRYGGILWGDDHLALAYESWFDTRTQRIWALAPGDGAQQAQKPTPSKRLWRERNCASTSYILPCCFALP